MAKIDPYALKRPPDSEETRTFQDTSGVALTLTLRRSHDITRQLLSGDKATEYIQRYVDGEDGSGTEVQYLRPVDGRIPAISRGLCNMVALLEVQQIPDAGDEPYTFEEWVSLCLVLPEAMPHVFAWSATLLPDVTPTAGDGEAESGARVAAKNG